MVSHRTWTLVAELSRQAGLRPDAAYCRFESGGSYTYQELESASTRFASGLAARGIGPGDRVAIMAANRKEYLVAFFGAQKRRAILVPLNVELKGEFLRHQIRNCKPQVIITDRDFFPDLMPEDLELTRLVIQVGDGFELATGLTCHSFEELERAPERAAAVLRPQPSDVCLIIYTSGTSGAAKGVELTQCHSYLFGLQQAHAMELDEHDTYYVCLPLFHVNALLMSLAGCLVAGANAYVAQRFSASRWRLDLNASGASVTNMLGTMAEFLLALAPEASDTDHSVTSVMALPVSSSWALTFEERFGIKLVQVYGMTECNIVAYTSTQDPLVAGRVGPIQREFFDVEILDPQTGERLPIDRTGEICVRPKVPSGFMRGYHNMPDVTVTAWRDLWFHTGDAGRIDKSDSLHFVDRLGDTIRRRGENISSFEVEQAILEYPGVLECAVVGIRVDGAGGEQEVKVDLALSQSAERFEDAAFIAWCADRIPRYAVPRFVELHTSLPKTATGKIQKARLREAGVTPQTWDRQAERTGTGRTRTDDVSHRG